MTKRKMYRYLGRNGILDTEILLDEIKHIDMFFLKADEGKVLSNDEIVLRSVVIEASEFDQWKEIENPVKGN